MGHLPAAQNLRGVRRDGAGRDHREKSALPGHQGVVKFELAGEDVDQPDAAVDAQVVRHLGLTQVCLDEAHATTGLGKGDGQVAGGGRLALIGQRGCDHDRLRRLIDVHVLQVRPDRAEALRPHRLLVQGHQWSALRVGVEHHQAEVRTAGQGRNLGLALDAGVQLLAQNRVGDANTKAQQQPEGDVHPRVGGDQPRALGWIGDRHLDRRFGGTRRGLQDLDLAGERCRHRIGQVHGQGLIGVRHGDIEQDRLRRVAGADLSRQLRHGHVRPGLGDHRGQHLGRVHEFDVTLDSLQRETGAGARARGVGDAADRHEILRLGPVDLRTDQAVARPDGNAKRRDDGDGEPSLAQDAQVIPKIH